MLDSLISLSDLLTRQKTYKVELIDEVHNSKTKIGRFYEGISSGNIKTDEQAAELLDYSGPKDKNYLNLRAKLFSRSVNSVFFLAQSGPNYNEIFNAGISSYKNYSAIRILLSNRKREVAIRLAEKTFRVSRKYEFTDLNFLLSTILVVHYTLQSSAKLKINKTKKLRTYFLKALEAETEGQMLYTEFNSRLSISSSPLSSQEITQISAHIARLRKLQEVVKTIKFNQYSFLYQGNFYLETREYDLLIEVMDEGLMFFESKKVKSLDGEFFLKTRGALAFLMKKDYPRSQKLLESNLKMVTPRSDNWFTMQQLLFSLNIIQAKYQEAYLILAEVLSRKEFSTSHSFLVQSFKIKEAYTHFLVELGKIDISQSEEKPLRKFRLGRFLNETPTFSKDKHGVNISILVIQLLLLVQNKKYGELLDKLDALNMYSHRYLRTDNTFRSNCFIKMLAKLPDADYNPIRWERYVKKYRDRLSEHPFELSYHNIDIEVIRFETLYDLVVEMLVKLKK